MSYLAAVELKEAITNNTGLLARVSIKKGDFQAEPILPGTPAQLSKIQRTTLYAIQQNAGGEDGGCNVSTLMNCVAFGSRDIAVRVLSHLEGYGWLRQTYQNRFALTEQGAKFVNSVLCS